MPSLATRPTVPRIDIETVRDGSSVTLVVSGEVDLCTAPLLEDELRRCRRRGIRVIVDLERVEFMDCAGLRVLLGAGAHATDAGFSITPGSPQLQKLFALTGTVGELDVVAQRSDRTAA